MFGKKLDRMLGLKAKPDASKQAPVPQIQPLPFNLDLKTMQTEALNSLFHKLPSYNAVIEVELSAEAIVLNIKSSPTPVKFRAIALEKMIPTFFKNPEKNRIPNVVNGQGGYSGHHLGLVWGVDTTFSIEFWFNPGRLPANDIHNILSEMLSEIVVPNVAAEPNENIQHMGLEDALKNIEPGTFLTVVPPTTVSVPKAVDVVTSFIYHVKRYRAEHGISDETVDEIESITDICPTEIHTKDKLVSLSGGHNQKKNVATDNDASEWYVPRATTTPVAHL